MECVQLIQPFLRYRDDESCSPRRATLYESASGALKLCEGSERMLCSGFFKLNSSEHVPKKIG
jgi:hypothetical protein